MNQVKDYSDLPYAEDDSEDLYGKFLVKNCLVFVIYSHILNK